MVQVALKDRESFIELLVSRGFTSIGEFAKFAKMGYSTIQQLTSGSRNPSINTAIKVADALDMKFDDLFKFVHGKEWTYDGGKTAVSSSEKEEADVE